VAFSARYVLHIPYDGIVPYKRHRTIELNKRDTEICQLWQRGVHPNDLAIQFNITPERVYQIIKAKKNS